jgi:signal peptidase I
MPSVPGQPRRACWRATRNNSTFQPFALASWQGTCGFTANESVRAEPASNGGCTILDGWNAGKSANRNTAHRWEDAPCGAAVDFPSRRLTHLETRVQYTEHICRSIKRLWKNPACRRSVAAAIAVGVGVGAGHVFIGSVYVVDGTSMTPTYPAGTHLYGAPISTLLERGDVVLLDDGQEDYAVKRIVGLPGETVQLWRGRVFINREMLVEPYLSKHVYTYPVEPLRRGATFVLGEDQYFVLGDNRPWSADSRTYGPVGRKQIKRRVPQSEDFVCAYFAPYTLPAYGKSLIRRLSPPVHRQPKPAVSEKRSEPVSPAACASGSLTPPRSFTGLQLSPAAH